MPAIAARLLLLALLLPFSLPAFALDDTPQNREQQADRYLAAVPPQSMMSDMAAKMAETLPEEQRDQFKALMTKHLDLGRVTAAIKAAMIKTFTADELQGACGLLRIGRRQIGDGEDGDLYVRGHARHHERGAKRARESARRGASGTSRSGQSG